MQILCGVHTEIPTQGALRFAARAPGRGASGCWLPAYCSAFASRQQRRRRRFASIGTSDRFSRTTVLRGMNRTRPSGKRGYGWTRAKGCSSVGKVRRWLHPETRERASCSSGFSPRIQTTSCRRRTRARSYRRSKRRCYSVGLKLVRSGKLTGLTSRWNVRRFRNCKRARFPPHRCRRSRREGRADLTDPTHELRPEGRDGFHPVHFDFEWFTHLRTGWNGSLPARSGSWPVCTPAEGLEASLEPRVSQAARGKAVRVDTVGRRSCGAAMVPGHNACTTRHSRGQKGVAARNARKEPSGIRGIRVVRSSTSPCTDPRQAASPER